LENSPKPAKNRGIPALKQLVRTFRGLPKARTKPFTPKELNQQAKFRIMNGVLTPLNDLFNVTFAHPAVRMSAFNKAFSYNIKNATTGFGPDLAIDYNMVLISRGDVPGAESVAVLSLSPGMLQFTWNDNSGKGKARDTDKVFVAVFQEELGHWTTKLDIATRGLGKCELNIAHFSGKPVHGFIGFISADGKDASDSLHVGPVMA
jgi:hypothetical protein